MLVSDLALRHALLGHEADARGTGQLEPLVQLAHAAQRALLAAWPARGTSRNVDRSEQSCGQADVRLRHGAVDDCIRHRDGMRSAAASALRDTFINPYPVSRSHVTALTATLSIYHYTLMHPEARARTPHISTPRPAPQAHAPHPAGSRLKGHSGVSMGSRHVSRMSRACRQM